ncbi:hypothetical protein [Subtercola frigoramans]|uniref:DUF3040 domain-containing protein n=1 Tax=Subtercola frigoramans TaxID=120298 RepID=A0ABS2L4P1_9MICO|nr:hypothetical protein [Subtercola frigoramans]MBM7471710.1 hypothetical protein [Subtercola frigoramans]
MQSLEQIRAMSDDEVIALYNSIAPSTSPGVSFWADELERRSRERATAANTLLAAESHRLARRSYRLTWISSGTSIIALVVAIIAIVTGK